MTWINMARAARLAAGIAVSAFVALGINYRKHRPRPAGIVRDHDVNGYRYGLDWRAIGAPPGRSAGEPVRLYGYYPPPARRHRHQPAGRQHRHSLTTAAD